MLWKTSLLSGIHTSKRNAGRWLCRGGLFFEMYVFENKDKPHTRGYVANPRPQGDPLLAGDDVEGRLEGRPYVVRHRQPLPGSQVRSSSHEAGVHPCFRLQTVCKQCSLQTHHPVPTTRLQHTNKRKHTTLAVCIPSLDIRGFSGQRSGSGRRSGGGRR